jgi:hypothetical protein
VNNNTNDVKITSFEKGSNTNPISHSVDDEDEESGSGSAEDTKEELITLIKGLLFYKIDMPAGSSNRSILSSFESIESKLNSLKNCNTYLVIYL